MDGIGGRGIRVNFDPANIVMTTGVDPVEGVRELKDYIVHTHAKDGILYKRDPEYIYRVEAGGNAEGVILDEYYVETPLGQGQVNFREYLKALREIPYNGFLTIEREVGKDPVADIATAIEFLRKLV